MSKIWVSLTTTPKRIAHVRTVIDSLLAQSKKADTIILNIPNIFFRSNEGYTIPEDIEALEKEGKIAINRCNDFGPATKLIPSLSLVEEPDDIIITVDDDHIYPNEMVESLANAMEQNPNCACGGSGSIIFNFQTNPVRGDNVPVIILEGYAGIAYRRSFFKHNL